MLLQGQRTRSSRWSNDHPGSRREADTGQRGLDIRAQRMRHGQQYAVLTFLKSSACENPVREPGWNAGCDERCLPSVGESWNETYY